jgi:hypothetical protein
MAEHDPHLETERALQRLMPASLSTEAQEQIERIFESKPTDKKRLIIMPKWQAVAAGLLLLLGLYQWMGIKSVDAPDLAQESTVLSELDRVEKISDDGLFVDGAGSAVRKVRVRVIEESLIRDAHSGILVTVSEPRQEMYVVPINSF